MAKHFQYHHIGKSVFNIPIYLFLHLDGALSCSTDGLTVTLNAAKFNKHGRSFTFGFKDSDDSACSSADNTADEVVLSATLTNVEL